MERKLIDVSQHQGFIDWQKVKNNIDGAIIRCGYGSDIKSQDDSMFHENVRGCMENGIPFGVYLYSYAKTIDGAKSEAQHVLRILKKYKKNLSYPVYYDLEEAGTGNGAVERAIEFGNIIESNGYWCGIYANQYWWQTYLKDGLNRFTKWVAKYSSEKPVGISGTYDIWQYSSTGKINGITGNVDMNVSYRDFPSEIKGKTATSSVKKEEYSINDFIRDVQKATGAKVDGIAGSETISKTITVSAKVNSTHPVVKAIQNRLNTLGYNCGAVDGIAGPKFTTAVKAFQKANGCVSDGEITAKNKTWRKLLGME